MTKADRAKMEKRIYADIPWLTSGHPDDRKTIMEACAREVDRAVEAERANRYVCIDCGTVLVPSPTLCGSCYSTRGNEGMDTDDMRTIQAWRRT